MREVAGATPEYTTFCTRPPAGSFLSTAPSRFSIRVDFFLLFQILRLSMFNGGIQLRTFRRAGGVIKGLARALTQEQSGP